MTPTDRPAPPPPEIATRLIARRYTSDEILQKARSIHESVLRQSPRVTTGNFTTAAASDLALLFALYDAGFFGGDLRRLVTATGAPLVFDFSPRLTRSAGL